jgi:hypothetical protein
VLVSTLCTVVVQCHDFWKHFWSSGFDAWQVKRVLSDCFSLRKWGYINPDPSPISKTHGLMAYHKDSANFHKA